MLSALQHAPHLAAAAQHALTTAHYVLGSVHHALTTVTPFGNENNGG